MCECCGGHTHELSLNIEGMSCNHGADDVKDSIQNLKGIKSVKVNLDNKKVDIKFNPNDINENIIKNTIEELGYKVE